MGGELEDFGGFYRRLYPVAYRTALGVLGSPSLAEDATQEAFLDAYRRRGTFRSDGPAEAWLQRIVVNRAIDQLRRHGRRAEVPFELEAERGGDDMRGGDDYPGIDHADLLAAIGRLDVRQRAAVVLRYFHGYPVPVVGEVLSTSEGGASMLLQRAMDRLRSVLAEGSLLVGDSARSSATTSGKGEV